MLRLEDRDWKPFTIDYMFDVRPGKRLEKRNMVDGNRPFIGASDSNNGVTAFVGNTNSSLDKGVLGVNYNGSVCEAFYHDYECVFSDDVKRLHLRNHADNMFILLFMGVAIKQQKSKYQYAYKFNEQRMNRQSILLPITDDGQPDYQFMEDYTREMMEHKRKQYRQYVKKRLVELSILSEPNEGGWKLLLKFCEWKPYRLSLLGKVESGRDIYALERIDGDVPYITSGSQNNGIGYFVGNKNDTYDKGYIAFNRNGAVGVAFYHPYWSLMGNDCRKMHLKEADGNLYVGMFVATVISMQSKSFSYSRKLGTGRANKLQIMLPVTDDGQPDYDFMELFGKSLMKSKYDQYLAYG